MSSLPAKYKIYIASDHAGFKLKRVISEALISRGESVVDFGAKSFDPEDDYPDFIIPCAKRVVMARTSGDARAFGVVIGGSGQGEAMAANSVPGARAAVFYGGARALKTLDIKGTVASDDLDIVRLTRKHNDANILSLGARFISEEEAIKAVTLFIHTSFSGELRHTRRIEKF